MTPIRDTIRIVPAWRERLREVGLDSVDRVLKCLGDQVVAWSRSTDTVRVDLPPAAGGGSVFIKRYRHPRWRQRIKAMFRGAFFGRSRARAEFERLETMRARSAPVVRPVAYGERRFLHFVRSSFLITEGVPSAVSLTTFAQRHTNGRRSDLPPDVRRRFIESLSRCIADLHAKGLTHGALFWRNVLVRRDESGRFDFVLLDPPGRRRVNLHSREDRQAAAVRHDLAALAALAPDFCTRAEMLRFFRAYLGTRRLDAAGRRLARDLLAEAATLRDHELYRLKMNRVFHYHLVPAAESL